MSILQVKNQLVSFFFSHDVFEFEKHQIEVTFDKETADFREQILAAALGELETVGIVKKMVMDGRTAWILTQPIHSFTQQVTVGPMVADQIASAINFMNEMEEIDILCDKTKIDEQDLLRLVSIVNDFVEEGMDEDNDEKQAPHVPGGD